MKLRIGVLSLLLLLCPVVIADEGSEDGEFVEGIQEPFPGQCNADPNGWLFNSATGHWYKRTLNASSRTAAAAVAESWCGYLMTLSDESEISWLTTSGLLDDTWALWIGLSDVVEEGVPMWDNGEPLSITNWDSGEPNSFGLGEDYVTVYGSDGPRRLGAWNDSKEYGPFFGIVERNTDPAGDTGVDVPLVETSDCHDIAGWKYNPDTGHWYKRTRISSTFDEAERVAEQWCGYLVEVEDAAENAWIARESGFLTDVIFVWMGLSDAETEGDFRWSSGAPATLANWSRNEPNNSGNGEDYGLMVGSDSLRVLGSWVDFDRYGPWYAIVERDTEPLEEEGEIEGGNEGEPEGDDGVAHCALAPALAGLFPLLDTDDNSLLSRDELALVASQFPLFADDIDALFTDVDQDQSELVTSEELMAYLLSCLQHGGEGELAPPSDGIKLQRSIAGNGYYFFNREVIVTATLTSQPKTLTYSALSLNETLPEGWYLSRVIDGGGASTLPIHGDRGSIRFEWSVNPIMPVQVRYGIKVRDASGPQILLGHAEYLDGLGVSQSSDVESTALGFGVRDDFCHRGDTDRDWTFSLSELLRIIQFFTLNSVECASNTEDGYRPAAWGQQVTCLPHSGDYDGDWSIELNELLRMVQFYNSENGAYHVDEEVATEDGFLPGVFEVK